MSAETNKQTIEAIYAALERGDRSVFGASVHPNYVWRFPGHCSWSRTFEGQVAIHRDLLGPLFSLFATQYTARAVNLIGEGDFVVAEVRGDVVTKKGERYDNHYCFVFRFRDGKIAEAVEYCDTDLVERVLGDYDEVLNAYRARLSLDSSQE
ncbi:nuclear transport factor 2 family protein [Phenylobacterium sp.]|uniref:nuclear transport factor 2 family protein n=1 Tax=Phenylobacterium sp. TaxID=1871053 RepID=UPI002E31BD72|nr:nuclear transport factor 2 family protein [Phenylobacterium sp.]HEX2561791.1 nuclear transport factor 2 family protein [Phenylobacterium sp.]